MKFPFFKSRSPSREYYFGLFLKEGQGIGYIFAKESGRLSLVAKQDFRFSNGWENLTNDVDEVLFKMENESKAHAEKMIVFVFSHLVDERTKEIKKPYLQKIKELTKNLEIKPIGYIECYEAVSFFLEKRDGSPLTSILIELDENNVDVFIYKGGHKVHASVISRTDDIVEDLSAVFNTLGQTLLPNRIILYNSSNLLEESTKIITHKWSSDLFVQIPRVEILKEGDILKGCMLVFEQQMVEEVSGTGPKDQDEPPEFLMKQDEEELQKPPRKKEKDEVLGFAIGKDIVELGVAPPEGQAEAEQMGFEVQERNKVMPLNQKKSIDLKGLLSSVLTLVKGLPLRRLSVILVPVLAVIGILAAVEFLSHKAVIHVIMPSRTVEKDIESDAVIGEQEEGSVTIQVASSSVELNDVRATTGKRDIGDEAEGEVTIYNFDDKDKTFTKGTLIQVDNLQFLTNDDVKVAASALTSDASAKLPGKSKVKVTAKDIGPESNIDKGKRFKIEDLSSSVYFAMNDTGFSGGTRKTIKTVSKKDMDDLEASLLNKAKEQQQKELSAKSNKQITIVDSLTEFELSGEKFSRELSEEADSLNLKAKVTATYYYFDNAYLNKTVKEKLQGDLEPGYELNEKNIVYKIDKVTKDESGIYLSLNAKAKATMSFSTKDALNTIAGKSVEEAKKILGSTYSATDETVAVNPQLPPFNTYLPLIQRNIELRVEWQ